MNSTEFVLDVYDHN